MSTNEILAAEIFDQAVLYTGSESRKAFVHGACQGDEQLLQRVAELLDSSFQASELKFFNIPDRPVSSQTSPDSSTEGPGARIGPYKLLEVIGEGGMGLVYMAEQDVPIRRNVAIKIIKVGMDTKQVIARFEAERQALAMMDHPNIAHVLDAGTTESGRPYFVMDLVRGIPITEFCDKNKLTAQERIELFIPVCRAIQSAHQKGIIHRDIKPSNVLVALQHGDPVPKVIDFGIAKAINQKLTEKTLFTHFAQVVGTPAYMSPEQAEMNSSDIDSRTDVYSLGILLYELLVGSTPISGERLRSAGYGEMQRLIREEEPEKPSTRVRTLDREGSEALSVRYRMNVEVLESQLRGDLDWITMKCLEKDRRRRYDTPNELVTDLEHFFANEPVTAAAPSIRYKFHKFYRRNKRLLQLVGAAACLLILTAIIATYLGITAHRAGKSAIQQTRIAEAVNRFLNEDILTQGDPETQFKDVTLDSVLTRASKRIDGRFDNEPLVEAAIHETLGRVFLNSTDFEKATFHLDRALELRGPLLAADSEAILETEFLRARLHMRHSEYEAAKILVDKLLASFGSKSGFKRTLKDDIRLIKAQLHSRAKQHLEALKILEDVLEYREGKLGSSHPDTLKVIVQQVAAYGSYGESEKSEALATRTLDQIRTLTNTPEYARIAMDLSNILSLRYSVTGRTDAAIEIQTQLAKLAETRYGGDAHVAINMLSNLAGILTNAGRYTESLKYRKEVQNRFNRKYGADSEHTIYAQLAVGHSLLGLDQLEEAGTVITAAYEKSSEVLNHNSWRFGLATSIYTSYCQKVGNYSDKLTAFTTLLNAMKNNRELDTGRTSLLWRMARTFVNENKPADLASLETLGLVLIAESSQRHGSESEAFYAAVVTALEIFRNGMRSFDEIPFLQEIHAQQLLSQKPTLTKLQLLNGLLEFYAWTDNQETLRELREPALAFTQEHFAKHPPSGNPGHNLRNHLHRQLLGIEESLAIYRQTSREQPSSKYHWFRRYLLEMYMGHSESYHECASALFERSETPPMTEWRPDWVDTHIAQALRASMLVPENSALKDAQIETLYRDLDRYLNAHGIDLDYGSDFLVTLALRDYRAGNYQKVLSRLQQIQWQEPRWGFLSLGGYALGKLLGSMTQSRLENRAAAQALFQEARKQMSFYFPDSADADPRYVPDKLIQYAILRKEAASLLATETD